MASLPSLVVNLMANTSNFDKGMAGAAKTLSGFGGMAVAAGLTGAGVALVTVAADAERAAVSLEVMVGSAGQAKQMLSEIYELARVSPFGSKDFLSGSQVLMQYGVAAEAVLPAMKILGDIAAGDSEKLKLMTLAYGQMAATGRLMGQELRQMINAGFNPLQQISEMTGESMASLKKRMEDGGLSAAEVAKAFQAATEAGGRFHGMTERLARTTTGVWMTLKDEIHLMAISMGKELQPAANAVLGAMRYIVSMFSSWGKAIVYAGVALVAFLATMKAITLATIAFTKASAIAQAFSGPKGWAVLAAGAAAAAIAVAGLDIATADLVKQTETLTAAQPKAAAAMNQTARAAELATAKTEAIKTAHDAMVRAYQSGESNVQRVNREAAEYFATLMRGTALMKAAAPALMKAFRENESGFSKMLSSVSDEISILQGKATEASIALKGMLDAGVDPGKVDELRKLMEQRDAMLEQQDAAKFWESKKQDMEAAAEVIRDAVASPLDKFAKQKKEINDLVNNGVLGRDDADKYIDKLTKDLEGQEITPPEEQTRTAGAMGRGSAEAFSTIVQAMIGSQQDPNVKATEKQTKQLVKAIGKQKPPQFKIVEAFT